MAIWHDPGSTRTTIARGMAAAMLGTSALLLIAVVEETDRGGPATVVAPAP